MSEDNQNTPGEKHQGAATRDSERKPGLKPKDKVDPVSPEDENEVTFSDLMPWKKSSDLKEGTHIGRYQILGLLGKGGMGAVYKAYDPELDRSIAIKILTVKPHEGETASRPQARLMREAQALAKLSHPNVVSIFDVGTYEEGVYIAMEYVKGKTLREWLKEATARLRKRSS